MISNCPSNWPNYNEKTNKQTKSPNDEQILDFFGQTHLKRPHSIVLSHSLLFRLPLTDKCLWKYDQTLKLFQQLQKQNLSFEVPT